MRYITKKETKLPPLTDMNWAQVSVKNQLLSQLQVLLNSSYTKHNTLKHPVYLTTFFIPKYKLQNFE